MITEVIIIATVIGTGVLSLSMNSIKTKRSIKNFPQSPKVLRNEETKMFFVANRTKAKVK